MNKKITKLFTLLCVSMLMCVFITGCKTNSGGGGGFNKDGDYVLEIWGGDEYTGETKTKLESFLTKFNASAQAEELKVELKFKAQTSLPGTLSGALMTNKGPDMVIWDRYMTPAGIDILTPLDDLIKKEADNAKFDLSKFNEQAKNELIYKGKTYGLPLDLDPWGIYVNLDVVSDYNTKNPNDTVDVNNIDTWSKLKATAKKLTVIQNKSVTRAGLNITSLDGQFVSYLYGANTDLIDLDPNSPTYGDTTLAVGANRSEEAKRVNELMFYINDLYGSNICENSLGGTDAFTSGKLAMTYGSMFFPQTIKNQLGSSGKTVNYKFIPFPKRDLTYMQSGSEGTPVVIDPEEIVGGLKNGTYGGMMGGYGLAIAYPSEEFFRNEKWEARRDKSWEVIKAIMFDDEINNMFYTTTEQITARTDLVTLDTDGFYKKESVMKEAIPYIDFYRIRPNVAGYETFESNILKAQLQSIYEGKKTVNTAYSEILKLGNAELRRSQGRS